MSACRPVFDPQESRIKKPNRYARWPLALGIAIAAVLYAMPMVESSRAAEAKKTWTNDYLVVPPEDVAQMIRDGKKVVLVDVREPQEYTEKHIPGAISMPVRETTKLTDEELAKMADADVVIPYCLKDFRGFEGAKALHNQGVKNVGLFKGYGIKSWDKAKLPEAGTTTGILDEEALQMIQDAVQAAPHK